MQAAVKLSDAEMIAKEYKNYVYTISHDLSAPIRSIVGFSRLLEDELPEGLTEDAKLYLNMILQSGEKMQRMMSGLLAFSRLNTTAQNFSAIDMNALLAECLVDFQPVIAARQAQIEVSPLPNITGDRNQILQLFTQLIDNAIKFLPPERVPQVHISALPSEKDSPHFVIEDNGIGIEEKFHDRIFEIFRRLHADEEYPGVGMGLALAKKIVARHGGDIWVESSPLGGSAFYFTLTPLQSSD